MVRMVFCGVCKENRDTRNKWIIREHKVDGSTLRDFKICDTCAAFIVRKLVHELDPEQAKNPQLILTRSGLIDSLVLNQDNDLEITLSMDLAKARKMILDLEIEEEVESTETV